MNVEVKINKFTQNESSEHVVTTVKNIKQHLLERWKNNRDQIQNDKKEMDMFARHLRETYPDYAEYKLYHELSFGGVQPAEGSSKVDFPGTDSVIIFLSKFDKAA